MAQLTTDEQTELDSLEKLTGRLPEEKRVARARLRFKRTLPPELWTRMVQAKRAQLAAIVEREAIEAELRRLAPDADETDLVWWIGEQVVQAAAEEKRS